MSVSGTFNPFEEWLDSVPGHDYRLYVPGRYGDFQTGIKVFGDGVYGVHADDALAGDLVEYGRIQLVAYRYQGLVSHIFLAAPGNQVCGLVVGVKIGYVACVYGQYLAAEFYGIVMFVSRFCIGSNIRLVLFRGSYPA